MTEFMTKPGWINPQSTADMLGNFMDKALSACRTEGGFTAHAFRQFGPCLCGQQTLTVVHGTYTSANYWQGKAEAWVIRALPADTPSRQGGESEE
jgi:hypothetical protein